VLGDRHAGFQRGKHGRQNRQSLREYLAAPTVQVLVKETRQKHGTPLPIDDVWIAAHAIEVGAALVTFDAHFAHVPGLRRWR
jgi:tRNA(fMet)-specific endonuclease VapC